MAKPVELEINGKRYPVNYPSDTPLLYVLRDELGLTGSKYGRSEEHTSELQSQSNLVCRLLLEKKKKHRKRTGIDTQSLHPSGGVFPTPLVPRRMRTLRPTALLTSCSRTTCFTARESASLHAT